MITIGRSLFVFTHFVLIFTFYTTNFVIIPRFYSTYANLYTGLMSILFALSITSYYRAGFTQAGPIQVKLPPEPKLCEQLGKVCQKCKAWKPPRAHHCKTCKKCIFRMDHHCEWINNCVGSHNQKYFMLFLLYTFLLSILTFLLNLIGIVYWTSMQRKVIHALFDITTTKIQVASVLLLTVFFAFFTADFLYGQIEVICDNQTTVESHKEVFGKPDNFVVNLRQVFGLKMLHWVLPIAPNLEMNYLELMYDPEYIINERLYFEDQFSNKSSQFYEFFRQHQVK